MLEKEYKIILGEEDVLRDGSIVNPIHHISIQKFVESQVGFSISHVEMRNKPIMAIGLYRVRVFLTSTEWYVVNFWVVRNDYHEVPTLLQGRTITWEEIQ
jgi:hypothetical protein